MKNEIKGLIILNTNIQYQVGHPVIGSYSTKIEHTIIAEIEYYESTKMYVGYADTPVQRHFKIDEYTLFTIDATMVPVIVIYDLAYKAFEGTD